MEMALTRIQPSVKPMGEPMGEPVDPPASQLMVESVQTVVASAQADQVRMADVTLMLDSMFEREEATVEIILNCLYDIGSVHWIDQRVPNQSLNRLAQWSARWSKPVVRIIALRWFKHNCPKLITNWLYTKVKFEPQQFAEVVEAAGAADMEQALASLQAPLLAELEAYRQRVTMLQARVRLLSLLLIGVILTLGGGLAWSVSQQQQPHSSERSLERSAP